MVNPSKDLVDRFVGSIVKDIKEGEVLTMAEVCGGIPFKLTFCALDLGNYTISFGRDKKGIYTSVYDCWDFSPDSGWFKSEFSNKGVPRIASKILPEIGTPIYFYDRFYWEEK